MGIGVKVGLEVGETGDKALKRLQEYPDEKRCEIQLCMHMHMHTHIHTHMHMHTQLAVLPLLKHVGMNHTWLPAPTGAPRPGCLPWGYLKYTLFLFLLRCGKPKWPFISRLTSNPEFEVIKYCL